MTPPSTLAMSSQPKLANILETIQEVAGCHALLARRLQLYNLKPLVGSGSIQPSMLGLQGAGGSIMHRTSSLGSPEHL